MLIVRIRNWRRTRPGHSCKGCAGWNWSTTHSGTEGFTWAGRTISSSHLWGSIKDLTGDDEDDDEVEDDDDDDDEDDYDDDDDDD